VNVLDGNLEAVKCSCLYLERFRVSINVARYAYTCICVRTKSRKIGCTHLFDPRKRDEREREREPTYLWNLDLLHEPNAQVFQHDAVRSGKEGQNVRDEVLLIRGELFPVLHVVL